MASELRPGGGFLTGANSQEESLCMRKTLYASLHVISTVFQKWVVSTHVTHACLVVVTARMPHGLRKRTRWRISSSSMCCSSRPRSRLSRRICRSSATRSYAREDQGCAACCGFKRGVKRLFWEPLDVEHSVIHLKRSLCFFEGCLLMGTDGKGGNFVSYFDYERW